MTTETAPANRLDTLPPFPRDGSVLTLGPEAIAWAETWLRQPNGPKAGKPFRFTDRQCRFLMWWYAVDADGNWLFHHGVRRLAKGSGKSPMAAAMALVEFCAPIRVHDIDHSRRIVAGKPVTMPWVQIVATSESQTANTMRMVRAFAHKRSALVREYELDPGKTKYYKPPEGTLEQITSSYTAAEGAESTFVVGDEKEWWVPANQGPELSATLADNQAKSGARMIDTCNSWVPEIGSAAEATWNAWVAQEEGRTQGESRILYDAVIASPQTELADPESLRSALEHVYADCPWADIRSIMSRIYDVQSSPDDSKRKYLNRPTASHDAWMEPGEWDQRVDATKILGDGEMIALAADLSKSGDATGLIACRISDAHLFTIDVWEPPTGLGAPDDWEVPRHELDAAVDRAFDRYDVVAYFAEPGPLLSYVDTWGERYGDTVCVKADTRNPVRFDMRSASGDAHTAALKCFTLAAEAFHSAVLAGDQTHDGDSRLSRHVYNARRRPNRYGVGIGKEARQSTKKVDAAVAAIIARMARDEYIALPESRKRRRRRTGQASFL